MKIYYFANIRFPNLKAHGIQIMKMCEALGKIAEVNLIVPTRSNRTMKGIDPFEYFRVKKNFCVKKIFSFDPYFLMSFPQGAYIKAQSFSFSVSLFFYLLFLKFRMKSEDIFYTRDEYLLPILQKFSKNVVWEAHTLPRNAKRYLNFWKQCKAIIVLTPFLKKELESLGVSQEKIMVSGDAVDLEHFSRIEDLGAWKEKLNLPKDKIIVMYSGHLYEWKGAQVLASAAEHLGEKYQIVFVGGTPHDVEKFKEKNAGKNNILIFENQPYRDIPHIISCADILVIPNSGKSQISAQYTSPLKFFEYLTTQKPIVASGLPTLHEIGDRFSGVFYFKPDDPLSLARAILACPLHESFQRDLKEHSWECRAKNIINHI